MSDRLIGLHNHQVQFELDGSVYLIPRKDLEKKLKLYWGKAALYDDIIKLVSSNLGWLKKYKV